MDFILVFITGLTTGGLSCLAVQGGLLASSLAQQLESDVQAAGPGSARSKPQIAAPILLFLLAKLIAYTLLGVLLGALGSMLTLTPTFRAILLLAVGIFMVGNGLRMLNVHPIFRFFVIEPPSAVTRYIRRYSKKNSSAIAPLFLGALTVLIPCGVTQSVMAIALGSGSPLTSAALMFSFTLGTSPVFFGVSYFATRLGAVMEKYFMRFVAAAMLILGMISIDSGLNLMGSPYSFSALFGNHSNETVVIATPEAQPSLAGGSVHVLTIAARNSGYEPKVTHAAADTAFQLNLVTQNTTSCSRSIVFASLGVEKVLPVSGTVSISIPPQARGTILRYACSMGMYTGQIIFD